MSSSSPLIKSIFVLAVGIVVIPLANAQTSQSDLEQKKNAASFVLCNSCHSLKPEVHLSGPSLANSWGKQAGTAEGYNRYSSSLKKSKIIWDDKTLDEWLKDPSILVPGTYMKMHDNGIKSDLKRRGLISFLKIAMGPKGYDAVIKGELLMPHLADGQVPMDLSKLGSEETLKTLDFCNGIFTVITENAAKKTYWEMNLNLKIDSGKFGPKKGKPVVIGVGSLGDRIAIVFSDPSEIQIFLKNNCAESNK